MESVIFRKGSYHLRSRGSKKQKLSASQQFDESNYIFPTFSSESELSDVPSVDDEEYIENVQRPKSLNNFLETFGMDEMQKPESELEEDCMEDFLFEPTEADKSSYQRKEI